MDQKSSNLNEESTPSRYKDLVSDILDHKGIRQLLDSYLKSQKKEHRHKMILNVILGSLAVLAVIYTAYEIDAQTNLARQQETDSALAMNVERNIAEKLKWMQKVNNAIIDMRKTRYNIVLKCQHNRPYSQFKQASLRDDARFAVALAFTGIRYIFNDAVEKKFDELTSFDGSIRNVCSPKAPKDKVWRKYQIEINNLMGQSIKKDQSLLINLQLNLKKGMGASYK